jgi:hypothetical protein
MGGHPYWYFVPYQANVPLALQNLRRREFEAGRYNPVVPFIAFGEPAFSSQVSRPEHPTIDAAIAAAGEDGTRSILDIARIDAEPGCGVASPLAARHLMDLYGTEKPTREMVAGMDFLEGVERGHCVYFVVFDNGEPAEICFAGYSYD